MNRISRFLIAKFEKAKIIYYLIRVEWDFIVFLRKINAIVRKLINL